MTNLKLIIELSILNTILNNCTWDKIRKYRIKRIDLKYSRAHNLVRIS